MPILFSDVPVRLRVCCRCRVVAAGVHQRRDYLFGLSILNNLALPHHNYPVVNRRQPRTVV
jgi:hypothetical protein